MFPVVGSPPGDGERSEDLADDDLAVRSGLDPFPRGGLSGLLSLGRFPSPVDFLCGDLGGR